MQRDKVGAGWQFDVFDAAGMAALENDERLRNVQVGGKKANEFIIRLSVDRCGIERDNYSTSVKPSDDSRLLGVWFNVHDKDHMRMSEMRGTDIHADAEPNPRLLT